MLGRCQHTGLFFPALLSVSCLFVRRNLGDNSLSGTLPTQLGGLTFL